jgi:hypothetical protein
MSHSACLTPIRSKRRSERRRTRWSSLSQEISTAPSCATATTASTSMPSTLSCAYKSRASATQAGSTSLGKRRSELLSWSVGYQHSLLSIHPSRFSPASTRRGGGTGQEIAAVTSSVTFFSTMGLHFFSA